MSNCTGCVYDESPATCSHPTQGCAAGSKYTAAPDPDWRKPLLDLLSDAAEFVTSERSRYYGSPTLNHERIAALWNAWLSKGNTEPLHPTAPINAADAAMMMALLKIARLMESPDHRDSVVDAVGYFMCYWDCVNSGKSVSE